MCQSSCRQHQRPSEQSFKLSSVYVYPTRATPAYIKFLLDSLAEYFIVALGDFNSKREFNAQAEVMNTNGQADDNWFSEADESVHLTPIFSKNSKFIRLCSNGTVQSSTIDGAIYLPSDALTVEEEGIDESMGPEHENCYLRDST